MTTFIDFRYSRALAAALFAGQEREEVDIVLSCDRDNFVAVDAGPECDAGTIAAFVCADGSIAGAVSVDDSHAVTWRDSAGSPLLTTESSARPRIIALRVGPRVCGIKAGDVIVERDFTPFTSSGEPLRLKCAPEITVLGRGSGRAGRWAQLFYHRPQPSGPCVALTMDWHHLRSGIPLFGTMTAEGLIEGGRYRLRFQSYAHDNAEADVTDFVRLFGCDAEPDVAVHLAPALHLRPLSGIPNIAYTVTESERVHKWLIDRCNSVDRVCVPSTFVRDVLRRGGVAREVEVVPHGVDTDYFRPVARKQPLPGGRRFNFLAVATDVERKNVKSIVRAFLEEFREHEDVALFLLVRPEYLTTQNNIALKCSEWERAWARNSAPILLWTGYVTRDHLRDFYANANVYVMPSNEGFGLTLLEAMSCGTPTIALNRGGVVDFVTPANGILVPAAGSYVARDVDTLPYVGDVFYEPDLRKLKEAMRRLVEEEHLTKRLGDRARLDAETCDWRTMSTAFIRNLEQTYADFDRGAPLRRASAATPADVGVREPDTSLTITLCVADDEDATASFADLQELAAHDGDRVLCLFTRYARVDDVVRARSCGFASYRWDGTIENAKVIALSLLGSGWLFVLTPGERFAADRRVLGEFLTSLPADVSEVSVAIASGDSEPRFFWVGGRKGGARRVHFPGAVVRTRRSHRV